MSSLLDQAIIDAKELREAAIRSAEQTILERYSPEVRRAVENILDEEESTDSAEEVNEDINDVPLAASEGEKLCPCPEEDEDGEIEIDFDQLQGMADAEAGSADDLALDMGAEEDPLSEQVEENNEETVEEATEETIEETTEEVNEEEEFELSEELELEEDEDEDLAEELKVDTGAAKLGWFPPSESARDYELELALAREESDKAKEELEAIKAALDISETKNLNISKALVTLQERNEQYTDVIIDLEGKINELLLINSKLLFSNRVLESVSLNERQKINLVEAISKARSSEEAKTIFESLKSVVGSVTKKQTGPQSLREATRIPSTGNVPGRRNEPSMNDDIKSRMQRLAGIGETNIQD